MRHLLCLLVIMVYLTQPCYAANAPYDLYPEYDINRAKDSLPYEIRDAIDEYDIKGGQGLQAAFEKLKMLFLEILKTSKGKLFQPIAHILTVIILCSLLEPIFNGKVLPLYLFGGVEILCISLSDSQTFFQTAVAAIRSLYDFSTVLLPCLTGASVAAGASVSAGVKYTAAALFMNLLLNFSNTFLVPLISVYLLSVIGSNIFEQRILTVIADFIRWGCKIILTGSTILFTGYLNIAGLITSTGDMLALRMTKSVISGVLPVVGNVISGAASSLVAGAAVLRNSMGIFGLLSVTGILMVPFINLGLRYFLYTAMSKVAMFFPNHRFSSLIEGIAAAYGMMLGVIGAGFIMIFLTIVSFMQIVGG